MVTVFCSKCDTKLSSVRSEERPEKSSTTHHVLIKNVGWCNGCKKTVKITTEVSS